MSHVCCCPEHALQHVQQQRAKAEQKKAAAERKADRAKREAIKTAKELRPEAQAAFNAFIRFRDRFQPCICCGKPFESDKPGGAMDAGHFRSRGSAPHLAFNEDNCHAQRKNCNRPGGTTYDRYRAGLIARIGLARVEALEANNEARRFRAEDYRAIRDQYRAKLAAAKAEAKGGA